MLRTVLLALMLAGCAQKPVLTYKPLDCKGDQTQVDECRQANLIAGLIWQSAIMGP